MFGDEKVKFAEKIPENVVRKIMISMGFGPRAGVPGPAGPAKLNASKSPKFMARAWKITKTKNWKTFGQFTFLEFLVTTK